MPSLIIKKFIEALNAQSLNVVDLTHTLNSSFPILTLPEKFGQTWAFKKEIISKYDEKGPSWYWNNFSCGEHTGTHFDAPAHWVTGVDVNNNTVDTLDASKFLGEAIVVDAVEQVRNDDNWILTKDFLLQWESKHGRIPDNCVVLFRSGWAGRIQEPQVFSNIIDEIPNTPGPDQEAVEWLVNNRNVRGFGVETINIDAGSSSAWSIPYPCHHFMLGSGRFGLQCLNNLDKLPERDIIIISAPLKIEDGSGSPLRVLAIY
ncbi:cyclase family protein [Serratia proteamaculans]|jgi:kynurenine formamidase|uniref:cyclase family protein n=1 Tax=Serratia proteamaculans TaxID=28151 RepID=UPI000D95A0D0|nr:cyclase family protein [Serratia proteamaculans]SPZ51828.1 arylformamidase [Serratia quinivorans]CAI0970543.1 arylformamidase [Serratia proteamaculans]CAI1116449.1 arylformamidase [Serratia proteamaculans]CAI1180095.1 arylformamidase [Serratia proteamaculans]CAI1610491.1 arylformamidase [Serratia proteamaculans]